MLGTIPQIIKKRPTLIKQNNLIRISPFPRETVLTEKRNNLKLYAAHYCEESTIHGIKYIGERGRFLLERLVWTAIVVVVCALCLSLVRQTYLKWQYSPLIVTFANVETHISKIPFPAVTICHEAKFDTEIFNFSDTFQRFYDYEDISAKEEEYLHLSLLVCGATMRKVRDYILPNMSTTSFDGTTNRLVQMLPHFDPLNITTATWLGKELERNEAFFQSVTSEGVCYTFNMLPHEEIFRFGYAKLKTKSSRDDYPRRTFIPGVRGGLTIDYLYTNKNHIDPFCEGSIQGHKVVLHHPSERPNMDKSFRVPLDQAVFVGIKPSFISVSPELVNYAPRVRNCYFTHERYLASYKMYTQQNCMEECLANYTVKRCKCIPFYFPPLHGKVTICGPGSSECVRESQLMYMEGERGEPCECLPSCTSLSYDVETSQTNWLWRDALEASHSWERLVLNEVFKDAQFSQLSVYYKDAQFLTCERKELHGLVDFFSNVGGLFGLFIGFSVTSVFEILYFLTLRIVCNIKKYGKDAWSGDNFVISKQPLTK